MIYLICGLLIITSFLFVTQKNFKKLTLISTMKYETFNNKIKDKKRKKLDTNMV